MPPSMVNAWMRWLIRVSMAPGPTWATTTPPAISDNLGIPRNGATGMLTAGAGRRDLACFEEFKRSFIELVDQKRRGFSKMFIYGLAITAGHGNPYIHNSSPLDSPLMVNHGTSDTKKRRTRKERIRSASASSLSGQSLCSDTKQPAHRR